MGFLLSPGVEINEIDLTDIVPAVSTSIGAFAGFFKWGPTGVSTTVTSEKDLARVFGTPDTAGDLETSFLTAASFLKYGNALKVSRAVGGAFSGNSASIADLQVSSIEELATGVAGNSPELTDVIAARYPGALGNSIEVHFATNALWADITVQDSLNYQPTTTTWSEDQGEATSMDEVHIVVVDKGGKLTGKAGTVLEIFHGLSLAYESKNQYGESNYWAEHLNKNSAYVYGLINTNETLTSSMEVSTTLVGTPEVRDIDDNITAAASANWAEGGVTLAHGADDLVADNSPELATGSMTANAVIDALDIFADAEIIDVNLLFAHGFNEAGTYTGTDSQAVDTKLIEIATSRKDLVTFISAPLNVASKTSDAAKKTSVLDKANLITSSSYVVLDSTPVYVYNKYRDGYAWIPASGHIAGLCAATDESDDPWFSPAGLNRGHLRGVTKLAFNPKEAIRDELYKASVNSIVSFPGQGILLYGDKTALAKPSAFDRINVRRLFITLEKAIATAAKFQLFELNDEFTRSAFRNAVVPFLRNVQGRRGITDFRVVCDETNNTAEIIDTNRFISDIYIKPARSINFVTLNFIATRTGIAFEELIGR